MKERGSTIPEMAIVAGVGLMLFFGAVRLALIGYYQIMSDGTAFVAARTYAQNPDAGQGNAQTAALKIFPRMPSSGLSMSVVQNTVSSTATQQTQGLMIPGAASTVNFNSVTTERVGATSPSVTATPYPFTISATLVNYRFANGNGKPKYTISIADGSDISTTGSGSNGRFGEWKCRAGVYSTINLPATRPTDGGPGSNWDPNTARSPVNQIYQWDSGRTCQ